MNYIMSEPIPIKKEEEKSSFFFNWYKKEKEVEKKVEEDEIFEMDDDELPPKVKDDCKNGLDAKLSDSDERDDELSHDEDDESISEDEYEEQDEFCFGYPCSNNKFYGYCKRCEKNSMCQLIFESVEQGMNDMREDIKTLWKKDVVKIWTAFLTVCYFNIPHHAMFAGFMYYVDQKFKEYEKNMVNRIQIDSINELDNNEDFNSDDDTNKEETKKCV